MTRTENVNAQNLSIIVCVLVIYSFIIQSVFGHQTFWRRPWKSLFHRSQKDFIPQKKKIRNSVVKYDRNRCQIFDSCDFILLEIMGYLDCYDILYLSSVCCRFKQLVATPLIWKSLCHVFLPQIDEIFPTLNNGIILKTAFFKILKLYPLRIAQSKLYVVIHKRVYNLRSFINLHPGGSSIIQEYEGKDASIVYDIAYHSLEAESMSEAYLVWSPPPPPLRPSLYSWLFCLSSDL